MSFYRRYGKRGLDLVIASAALVALAPLMIVIAAAVRCNLGSPVLFHQLRPGLTGRPFWLIKFRTMTDERDPFGSLCADEKRLTRFGRWLRSTSLDELPELWNVLRGDMSIVGPRPLLREYLDRYTPEQARRHDVKPGITGWAQVHGRNTISWEERFKLDGSYVRNQSLWLDLKILLLTFVVVLSRRGISADDHATIPHFERPSGPNLRHDRAA